MFQDKIATVLWDIKEEDIKSLPVDFIIKRALVYGGAFLIHDTIHNYGIDETKKVFESIKISEFSKNRHHFFKNYLFV